MMEVASLSESISSGNIVELSRRDILLQLYCERKIDSPQMRAGRHWQHHMEVATIQPCASIDPSISAHYQIWQKNGDLTDRQHRAISKRRFVSDALGYKGIVFLDLVLAPDVGRSDAIRLTRVSGNQLFLILNWLLTGLSIYYGYRTSYSNEFEAFLEAANRREKFDADTSIGNTTVIGMIRETLNRDTEVVRSWN